MRPKDEPGRQIDNLWIDIEAIGAQASERLGYPTQKPEALLERIIKASSNEGDIVFDPFCGCGTTVNVAERLNRKWIGIDITYLAINLIKRRLADTFGDDLSPYEVTGEPKHLSGAQALAEHNRFQFEWWAIDKVGARPAGEKKKGADRGIDGYLYFVDSQDGTYKKIIVQVKSGHVKRGDIATLKGDVEREKAVIGAFVTLEEPSRNMKIEAIEAGFYIPDEFPQMRFQRIQILTIKEILDGKQIEYPRVSHDITYKKAARVRKFGQQGAIEFDH